jgi:hypothetical protein
MMVVLVVGYIMTSCWWHKYGIDGCGDADHTIADIRTGNGRKPNHSTTIGY